MAHFGWLTYRSGEIRKQYDEVIALYLQSPDGNVFYDLFFESDLTKRYIPTPLCNNNPFELFTFGLYYTRDEKTLNITPCNFK